jgi:hypothetical protein
MARRAVSDSATCSNQDHAKQVTNRSKEALHSLIVCCAANRDLYSIPHGTLAIPVLVPSRIYPVDVDFECTAPETGGSGEMEVVLLREGSSDAITSRRISIPVSEVD